MILLILQPHTVVVGRAAILLECAHLVHNCNKGQWPYWLKSNVAKNAGMSNTFDIFCEQKVVRRALRSR